MSTAVLPRNGVVMVTHTGLLDALVGSAVLLEAVVLAGLVLLRHGEGLKVVG